MKKIPSLFKTDYSQTKLAHNEVTPGCEWVLKGEGVATIKYDGTACMVRDNQLFRRYDRKPHRKTGKVPEAPIGWEPCEDSPNAYTGHWPGWKPINNDPNDKWHREAFAVIDSTLPDGTYELIGPKIAGNPYNIDEFRFLKHGSHTIEVLERDFENIKNLLSTLPHEGIVFHHQDGRMCKIRRDHFGFKWPLAVFETFALLAKDVMPNEPSLFLSNDGNPQLIWEDHSGKEIEVEFYKNRIEFYLAANEEEGSLPVDEMSRLIEKIQMNE